MRSENPGWILVEGSSSEAIQKAIIEHSDLTRHVQPSTHRVSVFALDADRWGVVFDPPIPPYAFTNLIGWLDDPNMTPGARSAVGWLIAPGSQIRYFLVPQHVNGGGDTLVGLGASGTRISVFLPDCSVRRHSGEVTPVPEPELHPQGAQSTMTFEITVDADSSFGNPGFVVR